MCYKVVGEKLRLAGKIFNVNTRIKLKDSEYYLFHKSDYTSSFIRKIFFSLSSAKGISITFSLLTQPLKLKSGVQIIQGLHVYTIFQR